MRASAARRGPCAAGRWPRGVLALVTAAALAGCDLEEVTIVDVEPVVVAEVLVQVGGGGASVYAFLHRTISGDVASLPLLTEATATVRRDGGGAFDLVHMPFGPGLSSCVDELVSVDVHAACLVAERGEDDDIVRPGDLLFLEIRLPGGGILEGATRVPGSFELLTPAVPACTIDPGVLIPVVWSRSDGAWAYINETRIRGVGRRYGVRDPLDLLGLSISAEDTTIVFPSEFGVFDRFDLDQELAVALQAGLPDSTSAEVVVAAADRNYVNWVRGGSFNPSGQVRIPSLRGDGTGFFGSTVSRAFGTATTSLVPGLVSCLPSTP